MSFDSNKYDAIFNNKDVKFDEKVQNLFEVWKKIRDLNLKDFEPIYVLQLIDWAKLHALNIVLMGEWQKTTEENHDMLLNIIKEAQTNLNVKNKTFGARIQKLLDVIKKPWEDPILNTLLNSKDAEIGPKEIEFFCVETAYLISVRLKKLCENHCPDLALNLTSNFLKCNKLSKEQNFTLSANETQVWYIIDTHIALLYKFHDKTRIVRQFEELELKDGVDLIKRFSKKRVQISKIWKHCHKIAIFGARFFLSKALMNFSIETRPLLLDLMKVYIHLSNTDALMEEFIGSVRSLTNLADAAGLCALCEVIHEGAGEKLRHFAIEMYIRALTTDMNELQRLKHQNEHEKVCPTTSRLASSFMKLSELLDEHVNVARECVLTAFSLEPTKDRLKQIEELGKRSGFEVLDTGQEWKCKLHPPALPSDDVAWECSECGDWMCKPTLTATIQTNFALNEALQASALGISQALCDDLVVCLSNPRYHVLSWLLEWNDLFRLCIMYLNDPEKTKNFITELKFVDIDYSQFEHIKKEPIDEYTGIEKGYEQYLDMDFVSDEDYSSEGESRDSQYSSSKTTEDSLSNIIPPKAESDPTTLKSLRMFRPNLKRKKDQVPEMQTELKKIKLPLPISRSTDSNANTMYINNRTTPATTTSSLMSVTPSTLTLTKCLPVTTFTPTSQVFTKTSVYTNVNKTDSCGSQYISNVHTNVGNKTYSPSKPKKLTVAPMPTAAALRAYKAEQTYRPNQLKKPTVVPTSSAADLRAYEAELLRNFANKVQDDFKSGKNHMKAVSTLNTNNPGTFLAANRQHSATAVGPNGQQASKNTTESDSFDEFIKELTKLPNLKRNTAAVNTNTVSKNVKAATLLRLGGQLVALESQQPTQVPSTQETVADKMLKTKTKRRSKSLECLDSNRKGILTRSRTLERDNNQSYNQNSQSDLVLSQMPKLRELQVLLTPIPPAQMEQLQTKQSQTESLSQPQSIRSSLPLQESNREGQELVVLLERLAMTSQDLCHTTLQKSNLQTQCLCQPCTKLPTTEAELVIQQETSAPNLIVQLEKHLCSEQQPLRNTPPQIAPAYSFRQTNLRASRSCSKVRPATFPAPTQMEEERSPTPPDNSLLYLTEKRVCARLELLTKKKKPSSLTDSVPPGNNNCLALQQMQKQAPLLCNRYSNPIPPQKQPSVSISQQNTTTVEVATLSQTNLLPSQQQIELRHQDQDSNQELSLPPPPITSCLLGFSETELHWSSKPQELSLKMLPDSPISPLSKEDPCQNTVSLLESDRQEEVRLFLQEPLTKELCNTIQTNPIAMSAEPILEAIVEQPSLLPQPVLPKDTQVTDNPVQSSPKKSVNKIPHLLAQEISKDMPPMCKNLFRPDQISKTLSQVPISDKEQCPTETLNQSYNHRSLMTLSSSMEPCLESPIKPTEVLPLALLNKTKSCPVSAKPKTQTFQCILRQTPLTSPRRSLKQTESTSSVEPQTLSEQQSSRNRTLPCLLFPYRNQPTIKPLKVILSKSSVENLLSVFIKTQPRPLETQTKTSSYQMTTGDSISMKTLELMEQCQMDGDSHHNSNELLTNCENANDLIIEQNHDIGDLVLDLTTKALPLDLTCNARLNLSHSNSQNDSQVSATDLTKSIEAIDLTKESSKSYCEVGAVDLTVNNNSYSYDNNQNTDLDIDLKCGIEKVSKLNSTIPEASLETGLLPNDLNSNLVLSDPNAKDAFHTEKINNIGSIATYLQSEHNPGNKNTTCVSDNSSTNLKENSIEINFGQNENLNPVESLKPGFINDGCSHENRSNLDQSNILELNENVAKTLTSSSSSDSGVETKSTKSDADDESDCEIPKDSNNLSQENNPPTSPKYIDKNHLYCEDSNDVNELYLQLEEELTKESFDNDIGDTQREMDESKDSGRKNNIEERRANSECELYCNKENEEAEDSKKSFYGENGGEKEKNSRSDLKIFESVIKPDKRITNFLRWRAKRKRTKMIRKMSFKRKKHRGIFRNQPSRSVVTKNLDKINKSLQSEYQNGNQIIKDIIAALSEMPGTKSNGKSEKALLSDRNGENQNINFSLSNRIHNNVSENYELDILLADDTFLETKVKTAEISEMCEMKDTENSKEVLLSDKHGEDENIICSLSKEIDEFLSMNYELDSVMADDTFLETKGKTAAISVMPETKETEKSKEVLPSDNNSDDLNISYFSIKEMDYELESVMANDTFLETKHDKTEAFSVMPEAKETEKSTVVLLSDKNSEDPNISYSSIKKIDYKLDSAMADDTFLETKDKIAEIPVMPETKETEKSTEVLLSDENSEDPNISYSSIKDIDYELDSVMADDPFLETKDDKTAAMPETNETEKSKEVLLSDEYSEDPNISYSSIKDIDYELDSVMADDPFLETKDDKTAAMPETNEIEKSTEVLLSDENSEDPNISYSSIKDIDYELDSVMADDPFLETKDDKTAAMLETNETEKSKEVLLLDEYSEDPNISYSSIKDIDYELDSVMADDPFLETKDDKTAAMPETNETEKSTEVLLSDENSEDPNISYFSIKDIDYELVSVMADDPFLETKDDTTAAMPETKETEKSTEVLLSVENSEDPNITYSSIKDIDYELDSVMADYSFLETKDGKTAAMPETNETEKSKEVLLSGKNSEDPDISYSSIEKKHYKLDSAMADDIFLETKEKIAEIPVMPETKDTEKSTEVLLSDENSEDPNISYSSINEIDYELDSVMTDNTFLETKDDKTVAMPETNETEKSKEVLLSGKNSEDPNISYSSIKEIDVILMNYEPTLEASGTKEINSPVIPKLPNNTVNIIDHGDTSNNIENSKAVLSVDCDSGFDEISKHNSSNLTESDIRACLNAAVTKQTNQKISELFEKANRPEEVSEYVLNDLDTDTEVTNIIETLDSDSDNHSQRSFDKFSDRVIPNTDSDYDDSGYEVLQNFKVDIEVSKVVRAFNNEFVSENSQFYKMTNEDVKVVFKSASENSAEYNMEIEDQVVPNIEDPIDILPVKDQSEAIKIVEMTVQDLLVAVENKVNYNIDRTKLKTDVNDSQDSKRKPMISNDGFKPQNNGKTILNDTLMNVYLSPEHTKQTVGMDTDNGAICSSDIEEKTDSSSNLVEVKDMAENLIREVVQLVHCKDLKEFIYYPTGEKAAVKFNRLFNDNCDWISYFKCYELSDSVNKLQENLQKMLKIKSDNVGNTRKRKSNFILCLSSDTEEEDHEKSTLEPELLLRTRKINPRKAIIPSCSREPTQRQAKAKEARTKFLQSKYDLEPSRKPKNIKSNSTKRSRPNNFETTNVKSNVSEKPYVLVDISDRIKEPVVQDVPTQSLVNVDEYLKNRQKDEPAPTANEFLQYLKDQRIVNAVLRNVPGLYDLNFMTPRHIEHIVNVAQVSGTRTTQNVTPQSSQTSTPVTPHIQRIGQPVTRVIEHKPSQVASTAVATTTSTGNSPVPIVTSVPKPVSTQSSTLINILSQQIRPGQNIVRTVRPPAGGSLINILSQQIIQPLTPGTSRPQVQKVVISSNSLSSAELLQPTVIRSDTKGESASTIAPTIVTTKPINVIANSTSQVSTSAANSSQGGSTILQFICKSSLPKFQQAFGKVSYQKQATTVTADTATSTVTPVVVAQGPSVNTSSTSSTTTGSTVTTTLAPVAPLTIETKKIVPTKTVPINMQPLTGNVIYRGQVPVGQTISLIPPGSTTRQLFRITGTTNDQMTLVKETVIQNKMHALLAAALQAKPKTSQESNGQSEGTTQTVPTRITLCKPNTSITLPPNARIVKPVQVQIPAGATIRAQGPQTSNATTNVSSTTLEQLREFDMVYKQVKERSSTSSTTSEATNSPVETQDSSPQPAPQPQRISFAYVQNPVQKFAQLSPVVVVSSYNHLQAATSGSPALTVISQGNATTATTQAATCTLPKIALKTSKSKSSKSTTASSINHMIKAAATIPKAPPKPQEDEQTTQRIFDILAEYAEQLRNSPDLNNKPAPRRRSNPPTNPSSSSKRRKSSGSKKPGTNSSVETDTDDWTMGSEDSSNGNIVPLSATDDEQSQHSATVGTPPESQTAQSLVPPEIKQEVIKVTSQPTAATISTAPTANVSSTATARPFIVTDPNQAASITPQRNVIIADSSVGEALKIPNTALLVPGSYMIPVSMVKGAQQIVQISGGNKILTTVPGRPGQNMLVLQGFLNQNRKVGLQTVKYSTIQPLSTIATPNSAGIATQSQQQMVLPQNVVALGQPLALRKIENGGNKGGNEIFLTITQPREQPPSNFHKILDNKASTEVPQPDSSTSVNADVVDIKIEDISSHPNASATVKVITDFPKASGVATSVIASCIKEEIIDHNTPVDIITDDDMKLVGTEHEIKEEQPRRPGERIKSVLVNASSSNGPMLSHTNSRYRKRSESAETIISSSNQNGEKVSNNEPKIFNTKSYFRTKKLSNVNKKLESEIQKQAALERELRLQKSLSEECEDLGVDEPSTSDLFPEADLLFDANHSPSYEHTDIKKTHTTVSKTDKGGNMIFSDDENSGPLQAAALFDYVEYPTIGQTIDYPPQLLNGNNESIASCDDNVLLSNSGTMQEVTLNSQLTSEITYADTQPTNKYKYKYSNRKRNDKVNKSESPLGDKPDATNIDVDVKKAGPESPSELENDIEKIITTSFVAKVASSPKTTTDAKCQNHCAAEDDSKRGPRRSLKKPCSCCNGSKTPTASTPPKKRPLTPSKNPKRNVPNKKR